LIIGPRGVCCKKKRVKTKKALKPPRRGGEGAENIVQSEECSKTWKEKV